MTRRRITSRVLGGVGAVALLGALTLHVLGERSQDTHLRSTEPKRPEPTGIGWGTPGPEVLLTKHGGPFSLNGTTVTFPSASGRHGEVEDQVERVDARTGARVLAATTSFPRGFINWAVSNGPWTVYTDQSQEQGEGGRADVLWRVIATNTRTHENRVLASNRDKPDPFVPRPFSTGGYVYWSSAEPDRSARETLWKPQWPRPRPLLEHESFVPGSETIDGDWLYFLAGPSRSTSGNDTGTDCWRIRLDGTDREPVTRSGLALSCMPHGDLLLWDDHVDPSVVPFESPEYSDNPYALWVATLGTAPFKLHEGHYYWSGPLIGHDFLAWSPADGLGPRIMSLSHPSLTKALPGRLATNPILVEGGNVVVLTWGKRYQTYARWYDAAQIRLLP